jgi:hypothetical protein
LDVATVEKSKKNNMLLLLLVVDDKFDQEYVMIYNNCDVGDAKIEKGLPV